MQRIIFATTNENKMKEIREIVTWVRRLRITSKMSI